MSSAREREVTSMRTIAAVVLLLLAPTLAAPLAAFAQAKPGGKIVFAARPSQAALCAVSPNVRALAAGAAVADGRAEDGAGLLAQARRHRSVHCERVDPEEPRDAGAQSRLCVAAVDRRPSRPRPPGGD